MLILLRVRHAGSWILTPRSQSVPGSCRTFLLHVRSQEPSFGPDRGGVGGSVHVPYALPNCVEARVSIVVETI